jgi:2,4-dienoyl-CoA reductase-like NADH-dependent reductase (Old Yellow Enzyme family)
MEGWDALECGLPSEHTLRRWSNFGRSGAKLIWGGEAFAVQGDGRANPRQLYNNPKVDVRAGLSQLLAATKQSHAESGDDLADLMVGLQLTHSGRFSKPEGAFAPRIACRHPVLEQRYPLPAEQSVLSDGELEAIAENYLRSAELAMDCGFDFVDVKCCHGYLMHELLGAKRRAGAYGGSFAKRSLLLRRILEGIRSFCPGLELGVRVSIADTCPFEAARETGIGAAMTRGEYGQSYGFGVDAGDPCSFDLSEPFELLQMLADAGVRLVNLSIGSPYYNPHIQRPAAYPPSDGYLPPEDPLASVYRHLQVTRQCKQRFPDILFVGTGYSYLQEFIAHVAEWELQSGHVDFVGLGRMVLSYPELPRDVLAGRELQKKLICRTFSDCTTAPRKGLISGCYPLDPHYKQLPEAEQLKEAKRADKHD